MEPCTFRIVVEGELSPRFQSAFDGMRLEAGDGDTAIVGRIQDQSQLHGILNTVGRLGLTLVSVKPLD